MNLRHNLLPFLLVLILGACSGKPNSKGEEVEDPIRDSTAVAETFVSLLGACENVDFTDSLVMELGTFYKAAPMVVYRGTDTTRNWKDLVDYSNESERSRVDEICLRINGTINQSPEYTINNYLTEDESEGTWHVLEVSYDRRGTVRNAIFAFLKIGDKFALGDID